MQDSIQVIFGQRYCDQFVRFSSSGTRWRVMWAAVLRGKRVSSLIPDEIDGSIE